MCCFFHVYPWGGILALTSNKRVIETNHKVQKCTSDAVDHTASISLNGFLLLFF